jgi:hypothetical protein
LSTQLTCCPPARTRPITFWPTLQHAEAGVAPERAKTADSARRAEELERRVDRAQEMRNRIVAAAASLAAIAEEVALLNQDQVTHRPSGPPDTSIWWG